MTVRESTIAPSAESHITGAVRRTARIAGERLGRNVGYTVATEGSTGYGHGSNLGFWDSWVLRIASCGIHAPIVLPTRHGWRDTAGAAALISTPLIFRGVSEPLALQRAFNGIGDSPTFLPQLVPLYCCTGQPHLRWKLAGIWQIEWPQQRVELLSRVPRRRRGRPLPKSRKATRARLARPYPLPPRRRPHPDRVKAICSHVRRPRRMATLLQRATISMSFPVQEASMSWGQLRKAPMRLGQTAGS